MSKQPLDIQDAFLGELRHENIAVTVYLLGGVQLRGRVGGFDRHTLSLEMTGRPPQVLYKSSIATVVPQSRIPSLDIPGRGEREAPGSIKEAVS